jgi:hypothetical protein
MQNRLISLAAVLLLVFVFVITVLSVKDDSLTMDELAHLPAGYSYLTQKDMRLNPEHPPLIKDLAALPLLFIKDIHFPADLKAWSQDVNGQWDFGNKFLFWSGNPTEKMIFWSRMPMILMLLLLGFYIFKWAKELWGGKPALLALFLFSFSPTLLAHGRLVTTDVGAATGVTIATYYFIKFLQRPSLKYILFSGLALGLAMLTKFSTFLLLPFFAFVLFAWVLVKNADFRTLIKKLFVYGLKFVLVLGVAAAVIWLVYLYHVWNYPAERQARDTNFILGSNPLQVLRQITLAMDLIPVLRPFGQYLLGLFMVLQRGAGGNTTYFLGEMSASGWKTYFPIVYLIKEPLTFFVLLVLGILSAAFLAIKSFWRNPVLRLKQWLESYFVEFSFLAFIGLYWLTTLSGNLNIGVRHLLPIFPFTILLVSRLTFSWLKEPYLKPKTALLGFLLAWQAASVIKVSPSFLAYFNELAGGPVNGYEYVVDSNVDWGQDLKRLNLWLEKNKIDKIYLDYFGGSDRYFYLGKKELWWSGDKKPAEMIESPYLAVSATFLQSGRGSPVPGFQDSTGFYRWLDQYSPITKIGYSIFVYKIR